jgi:hypothetical protein
MFFAFGSYASDLAPFQAASPGWAIPRVEAWVESCSPAGQKTFKFCLT